MQLRRKCAETQNIRGYNDTRKSTRKKPDQQENKTDARPRERKKPARCVGCGDIAWSQELNSPFCMHKTRNKQVKDAQISSPNNVR